LIAETSCAAADLAFSGVPKWVEVANRMVSKGYEGRSPIPSNVLVFDWQTLSEQITATRETNAIIVN
jgi:hypothetical protein